MNGKRRIKYAKMEFYPNYLLIAKIISKVIKLDLDKYFTFTAKQTVLVPKA